MKKWENALRLVGMGWYVGACIVLGIVLGRLLDEKLNTNFLTIVGLLAGIFLAFYGVYRMLMPTIKK